MENQLSSVQKGESYFIKLILFFSLYGIIVLCSGCPTIQNPCAPFMDKCDDLQAVPLTDRYIIQLSDQYIKDTRDSLPEGVPFESFLESEIRAIVEVPREEEIWKFCGCGLVLMKVLDTSIGIEDRVTGAKSRLDQNGNMGIAGFDYEIPVGPFPNDPREAIKRDTILPYNIPIKNPKSNSVKVAIVDTGCQYDHNDLQNVMWENPNGEVIGNGNDEDENCFEDDFIGYDFINKNPWFNDVDGHGTHVAGIVASKIPQNDIDLKIMNLKVLELRRASLFDAVCGIQYAIDKKADIINLSWGYYSKNESPILKNVLVESHSKKIIIVTSAGNDNMNVDCCLHWPSNFTAYPDLDNVLSIAALADTDGGTNFVIADYSNFGLFSVDLSAAGTNILSAYPPNIQEALSGTSMAAPAVAGELAKIKALSNLSYQAIITELMNSKSSTFSSANLKATVTNKYINP